MREPYTPTTEQVREDFTTRMSPASDSTRRPAFDRWLDQVRREAKVEALREEADALASEKGPTLRDALMIQRLHYRADQLEREGKT